MSEMSWPSDWLRGVLPIAVLGVLASGPTYGYAISQDLQAAGIGEVKGGTLYPLLQRLEREGLVEAQWRQGEGGPGRKYFNLTGAGRFELERRNVQWRAFSEIVDRLSRTTKETDRGRS